MSGPFRARYGERNNAHALLEWANAKDAPPHQLAGLTDKPPGYLGPGDRWWPSVGCGPINQVWALWWTRPDEQARRGGMVQSEVFVWSLEDIAQVDDLLPYMRELSGEAPIPLPSEDWLAGTVEGLLSGQRGRLVFQDLDYWPGILALLWRRLWLEARRAFSARVAIGPPQRDDEAGLPWIIGIPASQRLQWSSHTMIVPMAGTGKLGRAARWLMGQEDILFEEVRRECHLSDDIGVLKRIARGADGLEQMRALPNAQHAIEFLRTIIALVPDARGAMHLKNEALGILKSDLTTASLSFVLSLANIEPSAIPGGAMPVQELQQWIARNGAELSSADASRLFERLSSANMLAWWFDAMNTSLLVHLSKPEGPWVKAALSWLGEAQPKEMLQKYLPSSEDVERRLFEGASNFDFSPSAIRQIQSQSRKRRWSRLHAWAAMQTSLPAKAFEEQWDFPFDRAAGLAVLVERLRGEDVVLEALARNDDSLNALAAKRTVQAPALLSGIDARNPAWTALWAAHVNARGEVWPPGVDRQILGQGLLDAILKEEVREPLTTAVAADVAAIALDHPRRAKLWDVLSDATREKWLSKVAEKLIQRCEAGHFQEHPERQLAEAVVALARRTPPSARLLEMLLKWNVLSDEQEAIRWMRNVRGHEWISIADTVGTAMLKRRWEKAAEELYYMRISKPEIRPALGICRELLSSWQRFMLEKVDSWLGGSQPSREIIPDAALVRRVAELGAELASNRLKYLWDRAGGKKEQLSHEGNYADQWQQAAELASKGVLKDGLLELTRQLRREAPHNDALGELERILVTIYQP